MNSSFKVFRCSRPTKYTQLQAVKTKKTETIKELIVIESEGEEEVVQYQKPGNNSNHPIIVGKWDYLENLNTEEIKNEILKDIKKETARNENVVAFWVAVLGH